MVGFFAAGAGVVVTSVALLLTLSFWVAAGPAAVVVVGLGFFASSAFLLATEIAAAPLSFFSTSGNGLRCLEIQAAFYFENSRSC